METPAMSSRQNPAARWRGLNSILTTTTHPDVVVAQRRSVENGRVSLKAIALCLGNIGYRAGPVGGGLNGLGPCSAARGNAAWDIDVHPDWKRSAARQGDALTARNPLPRKCAAAMGDLCRGRGNLPALAGGQTRW